MLLIGEVEGRLDVGEQVEQIVAQLVQRLRQASRQLHESLLEFVAITGLDDAKHGFRAGQIELAGQERAHREFARLGSPRPGIQALGDQDIQNRLTGNRVHFDNIVAGIGARPSEKIEVRRDRGMKPGQTQLRLREAARLDALPIEVGDDSRSDGSGATAAQTHDAAWPESYCAGQRDDGVVEIGESRLHGDHV